MTMKRSGARFLIASLLLLLLFFGVHSSHATESDPKGASSSSTSKDGLAVDSSSKQLAPPDNGNSGENKKAKVETKEVPEKNEVNETPIKKKDEILKEPEVQDRSKESSNGDSHVEECNPSNRCVDGKSNFVACLRVPGKDSQDLSLLIQNKGKGSLDVNITAPDFVDLEQNTIQLNAKENKEVKVTVKDSGRGTVIVLKAIQGSCSLSFQNTISDPIKKGETSSLPGFFNHLTLSSFILIILAAALLIVLVWSFIRFRRTKSQEDGPKYQQIDAGLPLSTGGKKDASEADGWDNSWGDDWDDEEAPMTPSKPVLTPSSKGLASRKFHKDSWKD